MKNDKRHGERELMTREGKRKIEKEKEIVMERESRKRQREREKEKDSFIYVDCIYTQMNRYIGRRGE